MSSRSMSRAAEARAARGARRAPSAPSRRRQIAEDGRSLSILEELSIRELDRLAGP